jgi:hypothetical protein
MVTAKQQSFVNDALSPNAGLPKQQQANINAGK